MSEKRFAEDKGGAMGSSRPRISVLMSVHNVRRYLRHSIRSILHQTFTDFEFLIVDDGSTDGSRRILKRWASRDARIHLILQDNQGLTRSLNKALACAQGEFVARMDADDISMPDRFETQINYLDAHPDCVAVGSETLLIDPEGWPIGFRGNPLRHEDIDRLALQGNGGAITHPSLMVRTASLRKIGGYREKFPVVQDLDLWLRLAETGRLANLPEVLVKWRQNTKSTNYTQYYRWAEMKRMALEDTMLRRNIRIDIEALLASDQLPSQTPRMAWAEYALKSRHPWTAIKNALLSIWAENGQSEAKAIIGEAFSCHYWHFRSKLSHWFH